MDEKTCNNLIEEARKMADEADCSVKEYFTWLEERYKIIKQPQIKFVPLECIDGALHHPFCAYTFVEYRGWDCRCALLKKYDAWRHKK